MIDKNTLENKLHALKIDGVLLEIKKSIFYTDYIIRFSDNVTINKINARKNDFDFIFGRNVDIVPTLDGCIALRLANTTRPVVDFWKFQNDLINNTDGLKIALGVDDLGNKLYFDLTKAPHLLVAGATGSGKSVFLNSCILSLLHCNACELVLIDVKKVEFSRYNNCIGVNPVATDTKQASKDLKRLCDIMDSRYDDMTKYNVNNFKDYRKIRPDQNYIAVIIDELGDIMTQDKKAVESFIIRLAQLGRACGIHLILATQRPSSDVVTGLIKANIPSRVCFSVSSGIESRIIIDCKGGETLGGNGDGLFKPIGCNNPKRIQAPYTTNEKIDEFLNISCR